MNLYSLKMYFPVIFHTGVKWFMSCVMISEVQHTMELSGWLIPVPWCPEQLLGMTCCLNVHKNSNNVPSRHTRRVHPPPEQQRLKNIKIMKAEEVQGDLRYEISDEREELCPWETSVSLVANFPLQHKIQIWILPSLHGHHPNSQIVALPFQH